MKGLSIYITTDKIVITSNGITQAFVGFDIRGALKAFQRDGNKINNKRLKRWMNY